MAKSSSRLGIFALWLLSPGYNWCGMHSCTSCCILFFNCNYIHYLFKISTFKTLADNLLSYVIAFSLNPGRVLLVLKPGNKSPFHSVLLLDALFSEFLSCFKCHVLWHVCAMRAYLLHKQSPPSLHFHVNLKYYCCFICSFCGVPPLVLDLLMLAYCFVVKSFHY